MKRAMLIGIFMVMGSLMVWGISPYLLIADLPGSMDDAKNKVNSALTGNGYDVIGEYRPGENPDLYVVVFTSDQIKALCQKSEDRGLLAAAMKVGFQQKEGKISVSILNPEYLFYAYFRNKMEDASFKSAALAISSEIVSDMKSVGELLEPFGGELSVKDLLKYHYMMAMPFFDDPVELAEFESFEQGLSIIQKNLSAGSPTTLKVYEMIDENSEVAVFGIGLPDVEEGEAHFLPIIGEDHVAAMPYEIILQKNVATMLHGRYRFALHWPELTMGTFTKIRSSPGDVENAMKTLVE